MEITIAIGLGAWFVLAGIISIVAVSKSFKESKEDERK